MDKHAINSHLPPHLISRYNVPRPKYRERYYDTVREAKAEQRRLLREIQV